MSQPYQSRRNKSPSNARPTITLSAMEYQKWRRAALAQHPSSNRVYDTDTPRAEAGGLRVLTNPFTPAPARATYRCIPRPTTCFVKKYLCAGIFCALAPRMARKGLVFTVVCWRACRFFALIGCGYVFCSPRCLAGVWTRRRELGFAARGRILGRWNASRQFACFFTLADVRSMFW
jgi:hypothetical protein